jgi:hypothetical protein
MIDPPIFKWHPHTYYYTPSTFLHQTGPPIGQNKGRLPQREAGQVKRTYGCNIYH